MDLFLGYGIEITKSLNSKKVRYILMKKFHYICIILFCLVFNLTLSLGSSISKIHSLDQNYLLEKSSSYYNLTGTYMESYIYDNGDILNEETHKIIAAILIDDTLNNYQWEDIKASYPWCTGEGTLENPYIIEDVYIDGLYKGNTYIHYANIYIRHSNAHFIICDCSLHRSGANERGSVFLYDVINGIIMDNEFTFNGNSIHLFESHNCSIKNNYLESNHEFIVGTGKAIWCDGYGNGEGSCNNTIESNVIINHYEGIVAHFSNNLIITKNFIKNILFEHYPDTAVYLCYTNYSSITYNTFAGDYADFWEEGVNIITQNGCEGNSIIGAFTTNSSSTGSPLKTQQTGTLFILDYSNYNFIYGNVILKNGYNPIIGFDNLFILPIIIVLITILTLIRKKKINI